MILQCVPGAFVGNDALALKSSATPLLESPLDFTKLVRPTPLWAKFEDPDYFIWCASMVRDPSGCCHLFYSRWPKRLGYFAWATHSEIARAEADNPLGPYRHVETVLPARGDGFWDGACTHNPTISEFEGRYYLYYMGLNANADFSGDISMEDPAWWAYRNRQRIGVAVADAPTGPWKRFDQPCISISPDPKAADSLMVSNPAVTRMPDGRYLAVYKAVRMAPDSLRGGPVVHLSAIADRPTGPFRKNPNPIFTVPGCAFPAEDPFIWFQQSHDRFYAIVKDMTGSFTGRGQSLALFQSKDGSNWHRAAKVLVADLSLLREDGHLDEFIRLERPQVWLENGEPRVLFLAAAKDLKHSMNIHVPLKPAHEEP